MTTHYHRRCSVKPCATVAAGLVFAIILILAMKVNAASSMVEYTTTVPFVSNQVVPNILLVVDNSGSMLTVATKDPPQPFITTAVYSGYFDPTKCYRYDIDKFVTDATSAGDKVSGLCTGGTFEWDGSLLNYVSMRRRDIARWVLTGGKCEGGRANGICPSKLLRGVDVVNSHSETVEILGTDAQNRMPVRFTTAPVVYFHSMGTIASMTGSFCVDDDNVQPSAACNEDGGTDEGFLVRVQTLTEPTGVVQQTGNRARLGLMFYNLQEGGRVAVDIGQNIANPDLIPNKIEGNDDDTWTPLAETLYEAVRYFAQLPPVYNEIGPDYVVSPSTDPYHFQPPWVSTEQDVACCKSYVIMFTDGEPTQDRNIPTAIQNLITPENLPNVAYLAHTVDLRPDNGNPDPTKACDPSFGPIPNIAILNEPGKCVAGKQSLTVYTFLIYGNGSSVLQDAAKFGGFQDLNGNGVLDAGEPWDKLNNSTGVLGADGLPDTYYESSNAGVIRDRFLNIVGAITAQSASGTAAAVLGSSSSGEGASYQAYFTPSAPEGAREVQWLGYTQGLFIDQFGQLREDTNRDGKLVYEQDMIVVMRFDTATNTVKVDRYVDGNGDGMADATVDTNGDGVLDTATPFDTVQLSEIQPIWEAGQRLALRDWDKRAIWTWVDKNNNGRVDAGEFMPFDVPQAGTLAPYLRAGVPPYDEINTVKFIRGFQDATLGTRDRQKTVKDDAGNTALRVWKLGDVVHSSPVAVGTPRERFDIIYGDNSYIDYFIRYRDRRQVVYVGANDGMLHAFNAGFYTPGDDPATSVTEHGRFDESAPANVTAKYSVRPGSPKRGEELWGFIPYQLLPHLQWLMHPDYTHVDYVDLTPKITDARIFPPDADHPNGWGTILIGGMRFGGSCGACATTTGGVPMTVTANFDGSGNQTRTFYSAYFVLDITNPEKDPVLLWSFSDSNLGLTTSFPAVVRVNPAGRPTTDNQFARWFMVVGSGSTTYDGTSTQVGRVFAIDLATGPRDVSGANVFSTFSTNEPKAVMGDFITVDVNLDYHVDVVYAGSSINQTSGTPKFFGKFYRLTIGVCPASPCSTQTWGISSGGARVPTVVLDRFPSSLSNRAGPMTAAAAASIDDSDNIWVYWGTGRLYGDVDKTNTETQYFFGVKDAVVTGGCTQSSQTNCERRHLVNVSNAIVCTTCSSTTNQVTGVSFGGTTISDFAQLQSLFGDPAKNVDGWFTTLPATGERSLSRPTIIGGTVFFTTFIPTTGDICKGVGESNLYALFFQTGSAFKEAVLGTQDMGGNTLSKRFMMLGSGIPSQVALQIGRQGTAGEGTKGSTSGCKSQVMAYVQANSSTDTLCNKPALRPWSAIIAWRDI